MIPKVEFESSKSTDKPKKDWFGYAVTGLVGVVVTILATWYQITVSEEQAATAEKERARSVRQSVIGIVEDQVLNGKKLESERVTRLIDQRRREQGVATGIAVVDVVQQAEFNILSSTYLSVERKEEIKEGFNLFYDEQAAKSFSIFPESSPNSELLNQTAKQIQDGQYAEALSNLRRLQEIHAEALEKLTRENRPTFLEAAVAFFSDPTKVVLFMGLYVVILISAAKLIRRRRRSSDILRRDL